MQRSRWCHRLGIGITLKSLQGSLKLLSRAARHATKARQHIHQHQRSAGLQQTGQSALKRQLGSIVGQLLQHQHSNSSAITGLTRKIFNATVHPAHLLSRSPQAATGFIEQ